MSQTTMSTDFDVPTQDTAVRKIGSFLGRNVDDVLKDLGRPSLAETQQTAESALAKINADVGDGPTVYAGGASLWGFIRGGISASIHFGSAGDFSYSGSMWTSPIACSGGGAGPWSMVPANGQAMDFVWFGGALEGGGVGILWSIDGTVYGGLTIVVAGLGVGGGKGSGVWTKA